MSAHRQDMLPRNSPLPSTEQARGHSFTAFGKRTANTEEWWVVYKDGVADLCFATHERAENYLTAMVEQDKEQEYTWSLSPINVLIRE